MNDKRDETTTRTSAGDTATQIAAERGKDPWTENPLASEDDTKAREKAAPAEAKLDWERDLVNRLAFAAINEQRRARRWGIFFKSLFFIYLFALLLWYFPTEQSDISLGGEHTALVEIKGPISDNALASADNIVRGLRAAFKDGNTRAVILRINSPGGSPVQAGYVYDEIRRLRQKYPQIPLYAVAADICASAAYYIASAADEIYADKASLVGSIGVLMDGYGFVETLKKLGIERRLITAGENKAFLDPFSPQKPEHRQFMQELLDTVHRQFIEAVKNGRGERLSDDPVIFSGLVWSGDKSVELGLVDGLGSASYVAREIVGVEKIKDFTPRPNYLDRFAEQLGASMSESVLRLIGLQPGLK